MGKASRHKGEPKMPVCQRPTRGHAPGKLPSTRCVPGYRRRARRDGVWVDDPVRCSNCGRIVPT